MKINDVLRRKGSEVATVGSQVRISQVLDELAQHDIGAVVIADDTGIIGILSERDIVRQLRLQGIALLDRPAGEIMTRVISTCSGEDSVEQAMRTMTERRVRHLPVVDASGLIGIVSIGDVVKSRIDELETTAGQLESYIAGG